MRALTWSLLAAVALLFAACGGETTAVDKSGTDDRGVVETSGSAPDKGSGSSASSGGGGRRFDGNVCRLLTAAEAQAALRTDVALTPSEIPGSRDEDRGCSYILQGVGVPGLVVSLQGERERLDPQLFAKLKAGYPRAVALQVRGAEAIQLDPSGPSVVVVKGSFAVFVQPVAWPQNETTLAIATKLAQPVAERLP